MQNNKKSLFSKWILVTGCIFFAILMSFTACINTGGYEKSLDKADSLMNVAPDSALAILDSLEASSPNFSQRTLRRWQLLRLMAQNKCDTVFHSDSLQLVLTDYYDRYGTPNERMTANYLLGRAYSDMGEAPRALQCYLDAVACADTTSLECDYNTLFRIYGQMANIYRSQCMPNEELKAWNHCSNFALKSGDIYNHIRSIEMTIGSYYDMGDTVSCLHITEQCRQEYESRGMHQKAASVYPTAIYIHLLNSNFDKAREMMKTFEAESGLFDSKGNISRGREGYYYSKGLYYLGIQKNDSAEFYFRKLQKVHLKHDFRANKGMLSLYRKNNNIDSVSKYAALYEKSVDDLFNENQTEAVAQAAAYNKYSRFQKESKELAVKAEKSKWTSRLLLFLFLLIAVISTYVFVLYKRKQKEKIESLGVEYTNLTIKYRQACHEAESLMADKDEALKEKEDEIIQLESKLDGMKSLFEGLSSEMKILTLSKSDIINRFKEMTIPHIPPTLPSQKDWKLLMETMEYTNPALYEKIILSGNLSQQEIYVCLLTMLNFSPGELTVLLDTSKQRVSNIKASANYKLFGEKDAKALSKNIEKL